MNPNKPKISVFDFDGTLFNGDSFADFTIFSFGIFPFLKNILFGAGDILKWKLGMISNSLAKERLFSRFFKGKDHEKITLLANLYAGRISHRLFPSVAQDFRKALLVSEKVFIISASLDIWLKPWVESMHDDKIILLSTEAETEEGKLTGNFSTPNCSGKEKIRRLEEALLESPDLSDSLTDYYLEAWGDSAGDEDILSIADKPHRIKK